MAIEVRHGAPSALLSAAFAGGQGQARQRALEGMARSLQAEEAQKRSIAARSREAELAHRRGLQRQVLGAQLQDTMASRAADRRREEFDYRFTAKQRAELEQLANAEAALMANPDMSPEEIAEGRRLIGAKRSRMGRVQRPKVPTPRELLDARSARMPDGSLYALDDKGNPTRSLFDAPARTASQQDRIKAYTALVESSKKYDPETKSEVVDPVLLEENKKRMEAMNIDFGQVKPETGDPRDESEKYRGLGRNPAVYYPPSSPSTMGYVPGSRPIVFEGGEMRRGDPLWDQPGPLPASSPAPAATHARDVPVADYRDPTVQGGTPAQEASPEAPPVEDTGSGASLREKLLGMFRSEPEAAGPAPHARDVPVADYRDPTVQGGTPGTESAVSDSFRLAAKVQHIQTGPVVRAVLPPDQITNLPTLEFQIDNAKVELARLREERRKNREKTVRYGGDSREAARRGRVGLLGNIARSSREDEIRDMAERVRLLEAKRAEFQRDIQKAQSLKLVKDAIMRRVGR